MACTDIGFRYRMLYIDSSLIQNVLGGEPLPFIADGLSSDPRLYRANEAFVQALDPPGTRLCPASDQRFSDTHPLQNRGADHLSMRCSCSERR